METKEIVKKKNKGVNLKRNHLQFRYHIDLTKGEVVLIVVDENGKEVYQGSIASVTEDGYLHLHPTIDLEFLNKEEIRDLLF